MKVQIDSTVCSVLQNWLTVAPFHLEPYANKSRFFNVFFCFLCAFTKSLGGKSEYYSSQFRSLDFQLSQQFV